MIRPAEGLGDPKITFLARGAASPLFPVLNTNLWGFNTWVSITGEPVSEVPFEVDPALGFSTAEKFEDLAPAFREPELAGDSSVLRGICSRSFTLIETKPVGSFSRRLFSHETYNEGC